MTTIPNIRNLTAVGRHAGKLAFAAILLAAMTSCNPPRYNTSMRGNKGKSSPAPAEQTVMLPENLSGWQRNVCNEALTWLGTPYKYAGEEKGCGTDCSGLVMRVFEDVQGWKLPRNSQKQAEFCQPVDVGDIQPGDLVFFATGDDKSKVSHVGIMLDKLSFVHASSSKGVVVSKMTNNYYRSNFFMYGRVPQTITLH